MERKRRAMDATTNERVLSNLAEYRSGTLSRLKSTECLGLHPWFACFAYEIECGGPAGEPQLRCRHDATLRHMRRSTRLFVFAEPA